MKNNWKCVTVLDQGRRLVRGSFADLSAAIRRGADLRIATEFRHNEHIDVTSDNDEIIQEVADFRVTYLLDGRWTAGIISLRQPVAPPNGFGPRPSMSFFVYNQDGKQAIARQYLDKEGTVNGSAAPDEDSGAMLKYHLSAAFDEGTLAPSRNFVYDFELYRYWVCDDWEEVFAHDAEGKVVTGSLERLVEEFWKGRDIKVGIGGLCDDLAEPGPAAVEHEVYVQCGAGYYYTESKQFSASSHPVVRVQPAVPLAYSSKGWDSGWLIVRSDGHVARWLVDPHTREFHRSNTRHALRWFVR